MLRSLLLPAFVCAQTSIVVTGESFKILHLSDVHFHPQDATCRDVEHSDFPCTAANSTQFIAALLQAERPDFIAFTGDVIDGASSTPRRAMDVLYGVASAAKIPWAASLGNHEDQVHNMTREQVYSHILGMPSMGSHGPLVDSPGNFWIDVVSKNRGGRISQSGLHSPFPLPVAGSKPL